MTEFHAIDSDRHMATPWRRRRMCVLEADRPYPAALESVSGRRALLRCNFAPASGARVTLNHPVAGLITGKVADSRGGIVELALAGDDRAMAFALGAVAADMSRNR